MATTEPTINNTIAGLLRELRKMWLPPGVLRSENTSVFVGGGQPDILIMEPGTSPVTVETEVLPAQTVEKDARSRLGRVLKENGRPVLSSVAVRMPLSLREAEGTALTEAISVCTTFGFACFTGRSPEDYVRWPRQGWVAGNIADLALVAQSMTIPPAVVDQAADQLVQGVSNAAGVLNELSATHAGALQSIGATLKQATLKQEDRTQTLRMATTMIANAFVFHASLAGQGGDFASIRSVHQIRGATGDLSRSDVLTEWRKILKINYWPIFDISRRIVELLPGQVAATILRGLADTADRVLESGLMHSHDLVGAIFQKLIVDRKFLAAYYTRPASAALLTGLALTPAKTPQGLGWGEPGSVRDLRIADFACGTGTLLSTVYQTVRQMHELHGGNEAALHPYMMSDVLYGCDIMPAGAHITASMLSGAHPSIKYSNSSIVMMPYGKQDDGTVSLGSLDLLKTQGTFPVLATKAAAVGGQGTTPQDTWKTIPDKYFHFVVMNPPFVRPTNHEGAHGDIPNPMFAAFASSDEEQQAMSKQMQKVAAETAYHGNAGEASAFLALGDRKLLQGGQLALVMPLSLQMGQGWEKSRALLRRNYQDLIVVNIAAHKDAEASFSADTGMGECLILGRKTGAPSTRALFVILAAAPSSPLEGMTLARHVRESRATGTVRKLEDGPVGGTDLTVGGDLSGSMIEGPLSNDGPWPISRVADLSIAQAVHQLVAQNRLWLPGMQEAHAPVVSMCSLAALAEIGPLHRDINGTEFLHSVIRGPFTIVPLTGSEEPTYPALWNHDADAERSMVVQPDTQGVIRSGADAAKDAVLRERAARIWKTASKCHFNYDFRFNSQSTAAVHTDRPTIGGRAWPSVIFHNPAHEKAFLLWANSTLGLLCHWWQSNKQQSGRGSITITALRNVVMYDFRKLSAHQLQQADLLFDKFKMRLLKPFNEIDSDLVRHDLDRAVLIGVLGFDQTSVAENGPVDLLRRKLAREPSIQGGKKSKFGA